MKWGPLSLRIVSGILYGITQSPTKSCTTTGPVVLRRGIARMSLDNRYFITNTIVLLDCVRWNGPMWSIATSSSGPLARNNGSSFPYYLTSRADSHSTRNLVRLGTRLWSFCASSTCVKVCHIFGFRPRPLRRPGSVQVMGRVVGGVMARPAVARHLVDMFVGILLVH